MKPTARRTLVRRKGRILANRRCEHPARTDTRAGMDPQARFEAIFTAHYRDIHRYALCRTDPAEAEEVVEEAFTICWAKLDAVPDPALPWLYGVARKCLANRRRAAARRAGLTAPPRRPGPRPRGRGPGRRPAPRGP